MAESAFSFSAFQLFSFSFMGNLEPLNLEPLNFERARAAALRPGGNEPQMAQMNADGSAPGPAPIKVPVCSGLPQTGTLKSLSALLVCGVYSQSDGRKSALASFIAGAMSERRNDLARGDIMEYTGKACTLYVS